MIFQRKRKAVVTGIGAVTPIGNSKEELAKGLLAGRSGLSKISRFSRRGFPVKHAFEVRGFGTGKDSEKENLFIKYALSCAEEAIKDSNLKIEDVDPYRFGSIISSSKGGFSNTEKGNIEFVSPDLANQWIVQKYGLKGMHKCIVAACATGTFSIIEGAKLIEEGSLDCCFAGASEAAITPLTLSAYYNMGVHSRNGMCPFDKRRSGFVVGEGAGVVLLEEKNDAIQRGARIYGEISSYAYGSDGFRITLFDSEGDSLSRILQTLLKKADIDVLDIDYFNNHGTSTVGGDIYETEQIKKSFGKKAERLDFSSTKSMVGHMLGAAGAVEFIACLLSMEKGFVPPTINYSKKDPACDLNYNPNKSKTKEVNIACSISLGFGGHVAGIIVRKI